jgi:hypothetical protein
MTTPIGRIAAHPARNRELTVCSSTGFKKVRLFQVSGLLSVEPLSASAPKNALRAVDAAEHSRIQGASLVADVVGRPLLFFKIERSQLPVQSFIPHFPPNELH